MCSGLSDVEFVIPHVLYNMTMLVIVITSPHCTVLDVADLARKSSWTSSSTINS
jgi:hypothetical protein